MLTSEPLRLFITCHACGHAAFSRSQYYHKQLLCLRPCRGSSQFIQIQHSTFAADHAAHLASFIAPLHFVRSLYIYSSPLSTMSFVFTAHICSIYKYFSLQLCSLCFTSFSCLMCPFPLILITYVHFHRTFVYYL